MPAELSPPALAAAGGRPDAAPQAAPEELVAAEEDDLAIAAAAPPGRPAGRDALAAAYMPFVRAIAAKVKRKVAREIEYDDLIEYGMIGLLEAADRFDPAQGHRFTTFAYYRIRGAIYDGLRGMGWLTRTAYAQARFEERSNTLMGAWPEPGGGRPAAGGAGVTPQAVASLAQAVGGMAAVYITSLDAAAHARLVDDQQLPPDQAVGLATARARVRQSLTQLAPQEQRLLELYYYQDMSLQEVGDALGLSKSWTSRLHARAIDKLQQVLGREP